jgi:Ran GTPase-activating protein (RanGAP) involved in mRNA processing and transport
VLHLSSNDISDEGASELAAALKLTSASSKLRELHLANNGIEAEGAMALAASLRGHMALEVGG